MSVVEIQLYNRKGLVVGVALISPQDEEIVKKYRWHMSHGYACCMTDHKPLLMTHLILGKPDKGLVIDHINRNCLDNRRENLWFATKSHNNQNRSTQTDHYFGICKRGQKWTSHCGTHWLGSYTDAREAATVYDKCAYILFGKHARTNGLITYDECKNMTVENLISTKSRLLPKNIYQKKSKFCVTLTKNHQRYQSILFETLLEAEEWLHKLRIELDEKAKIDENLQKSIPITRNNAGQASISCSNIEALVDDDLWHELSKYSWCPSNGYAIGHIQGKSMSMHRYVMMLKGFDLSTIDKNNCIIDHINHNRSDNRYSNLRVNTCGGNSHNRIKNDGTSSKYFGVSYDNNYSKWSASIKKDGKCYNLGLHDTEIEAALIYNMKATELYGVHANLNLIDETLYSQYEQKIRGQLDRLNSNFNRQKIKQRKYHGIYHTKDDKWSAQIIKDKIRYYIGRYNTEKEAVVAYNSKALELYGQLAQLNIIKDDPLYPKIKIRLKSKIDTTIL